MKRIVAVTVASYFTIEVDANSDEEAEMMARALYEQGKLDDEINPQFNALPEPKESCEWCREPYEESELRTTDLGILCDRCINAIRSRGETVIILQGG
jgi:formylmethanofuran dehydrogenase subunit E